MPGATGSLAHHLPISCPVASAGEAARINKRLQQKNGVPVFLLPIGGELPGDAPQQMTGQVGHARPRQNQQARVVGEIIQAALPSRRLPTDVLIARPALPGRRAKQHAGQRTARPVPHQVMQILAHATAVAQVVMPIEQRLEQGALGAVRLPGQLSES